MLAQEGPRTLTSRRPDAGQTSGRPTLVGLLVVSLIASAGVAAPRYESTLSPAETIVGRATWRGRLVLLTDAPALILVAPADGTAARTPIAIPDGSPFSPWGLGEADEALFTVSGFSTMWRLSPEGRAVEPISLERAVTNLVDLPIGMAAQLAAPASGSPLAVLLSGSGRVLPLASPARAPLGLSSPEENLLHLLSCSTPPRVICWLPNDPRMIEYRDNALMTAVSLDSFDRMPSASFINRLETRPIVDAVLADDDAYVVLQNDESGAPRRIGVFDLAGRRLAAIDISEPARLLVRADRREVIALTRDGRALRVRRP